MKNKASSTHIFWDTRKSYIYYPKIIKEIYQDFYLQNYKKFNNWIDKISTQNEKNISWWLSAPASRDERISNLFHNICILNTIKKIKNTRNKTIITVESQEINKLIKITTSNNNLDIKVSKKFNIFRKIYILFKEILILIINVYLIKIKVNNNNPKFLNILDTFQLDKQSSHSFYSDFLSKKNFKQNFTSIPTFLSYSPFKIYKLLNKNKNVYFKENLINFLDIISIVKKILFNNIVLKRNLFLGTNFNSLIKEETTTDNNLRPTISAYINYYFFKNLKKKNIELNNVISWFENQIVDKGWSLGVNNFYSEVNFIGYQAATLHPQFFNLSPTHSEYNAKVLPKQIYLVGKKYLKNRKLFTQKPVYKITKFSRYKFQNDKKKKSNILFLLSGIEHVDVHLLDIYKNLIKKYNKNKVFIKFHPILPSKKFEGIFNNEVFGNGSKIIQKSKIVITSSYTSGLYESMGYNSFTILANYSPLDNLLYKSVKKYSKRLFLCENTKEIYNMIKYLNKKNEIKIQKNNKRITKLFFNR